MKRLRSIVKECAVKAVGMAISKSHYSKQLSDAERKKTGNNFTFSVLLTMAQIGRFRSLQNIKEPIEYVFDWLDPKNDRRRQLEEVFENEIERGSALSDYGMVSGGYSFQHKEDLPALQAADIGAWQLYGVTQENLRIKKMNLLAREGYRDFQEYRKSSRWFDMGYLSSENLQELADQLPTSKVFSQVKEITRKTKY